MKKMKVQETFEIFPEDLAARIRAAGPQAVALANALAWILREGLPREVHRPEEAFLLVADMAALEQEQVRAILLDARNRVIAIRTIFVGTTNGSYMRPAEIMREAIRHNAVALIVAHNHPSGRPDPSPEDIQATRALILVGQVLGLAVIDHIIVAREGWVSLRERGFIPPEQWGDQMSLPGPWGG